jgi:hypothetical protein
MFEATRARLEALRTVPPRALQAAAPRIQAKLRADAKRGNLDGPILATATPSGIQITAPEWVQDKARELGQPAEWGAIVAQEIRAAVGT